MQSDEWIKSRRLLNLLWKHRPEWRCPEINIRTPLAAGFIRARARRAELELRVPAGKVEVRVDWHIPLEAWKGSLENSVLDLSTDVFSTGAYESGFRRVKCTGMSFNLADVMEALDIDEGEALDRSPPRLLDLEDFTAQNDAEIDIVIGECEADGWWRYPEAVLWVQTRSLRRVAALRAWFHYLRANGSKIDGAGVGVVLDLLKTEAARGDLDRAARAEGAGAVRSQGLNQQGKMLPIQAVDWLGHKVHLTAGMGVLAPHEDHRFAKYCDPVFSRVDLLAAFPSPDLGKFNQLKDGCEATPSKPDAEQVENLAAAFDAEGIAKRSVRASMISERWRVEWGPAPTKEDVWHFMEGGKPGRQ